jgi:hypothetical protein
LQTGILSILDEDSNRRVAVIYLPEAFSLNYCMCRTVKEAEREEDEAPWNRLVL